MAPRFVDLHDAALLVGFRHRLEIHRAHGALTRFVRMHRWMHRARVIGDVARAAGGAAAAFTSERTSRTACRCGALAVPRVCGADLVRDALLAARRDERHAGGVRSWRVRLPVALLVLAFARPAVADEVDDLVAHGEELAKLGEWTRAIDSFKAADAK